MHLRTAAIVGACLLISELTLARFRNARRAAATRADAGSLRLLWLVIAGAISLGVTLASRGVGPRLPASVPWSFVGLALFVFGSVLRWWAIIKLGKYFTVDVAVSADQQVVSDGPYALVRHPSYAGSLLQFLGFSLLFGWLLTVLAIVLPIVAAYGFRIAQEEKILHATLGESYRRYATNTWRLIPFLF